MLNRMLALAAVTVWAVAAATAWTTSLSYEALLHFGGRWDAIVATSDVPATTLRTAVDERLTATARANDLTIVRVENDSYARGVWVARPFGEALSGRGVIAAFDPTNDLPIDRSDPADPSARERPSIYLVRGSEAGQAALARTFQTVGVAASVSKAGPASVWSALITSPSNLVLRVGVALVFALGLASGALGLRPEAVRRLHGRRGWESALRRVSYSLRAWLVAGTASLPLAVVGLWAYNGLDSTALFFAAMGIVALAGLAVTAGALAIGLFVARRAPLGPALRNELRGDTFNYSLVYGMRIVAVLSAVAVAVQAVGAVRALDARAPTSERWRTFSDWAQVSGAMARSDDSDRAELRVGAWMARQWKTGDALFISRSPGAGVPQLQGSGADLFEVNAAYLALTHPRTTDGALVKASDDAIQVYVPAHAWGAREQLRQVAVEQARFQGELRAKERGRDCPTAKVVLAGALPAGTRLFSPSAADGAEMRELEAVDPLLVVWPSRRACLGHAQMVAWSSTGSLSFRGLSRTLASLDVDGLRAAVGTVDTLGGFNRRAYDHERRDTAIVAVTALFLAGLVALSAVAFGAVHVARHQQRTFVLTTEGWPVLHQFHRLFIADALCVGALLVWRLLLDERTQASLEKNAPGTAMPTLHWPLALAVGMLLLMVLYVVMRSLARSTLRHGRSA